MYDKIPLEEKTFYFLKSKKNIFISHINNLKSGRLKKSGKLQKTGILDMA